MRPVTRWSRALVAGLLMAGLFAVPVAAAEPVSITIDVDFGTGVERFTVEGDALCAAGDATSEPAFVTGRGRALVFHVVKVLTCDDGSGWFAIKLNAQWLIDAPTNGGGWNVIDGGGDYSSLRGGGSMVGTYDAQGVDDVYRGFVTGG